MGLYRSPFGDNPPTIIETSNSYSDASLKLLRAPVSGGRGLTHWQLGSPTGSGLISLLVSMGQ